MTDNNPTPPTASVTSLWCHAPPGVCHALHRSLLLRTKVSRVQKLIQFSTSISQRKIGGTVFDVPGHAENAFCL